MSSCLSCGADIPEGSAFCGQCGAPLASAGVGQAEERKVVSVLFCDLVGFTASSDQADPEDIQARLGPYHRRVQQEIQRFGGTVEKFIGDAVVGAFGAATSYEDDPERAVRAALSVLEAIEELNRANPELDLAVRVAVNTGEAVVTLGARPERGEHFVTGDVANTASRLQGVAPVGAVVVGEPTWQVTRDRIAYQRLQPVRVKGKAGPVALWRAVAARNRHQIDIDPEAATPLRGRQSELALLQDVYRQVVRDRSVHLVTIAGEPGIGKTRLVWEFRAFIDAQRDPIAWRQGRCLPYGDELAVQALGEVVKAHAGILATDASAVAAMKLGAAVAAAVTEQAERDWLTSWLAPIVGLTNGQSSRIGTPDLEEAFTAWRRFLEAVAAERPLVVGLEDLHWADPALLGFVRHLVETAAGVPLLVVCTARPELYDRSANWGAEPNTSTVRLAPLSDGDMTGLLTGLLDGAQLPPEAQAALLERAGGNPLYAEQVCHMLAESDLLERHDGTVRLVAGAESVLPASTQALIAARLDSLSPEHKAPLHDAAVVGKGFWPGVLAWMGDRHHTEVQVALDELARRGLVRPARSSSVQSEAEYVFWHMLTRDVAYGQLPRAARVRKHEAAAVWIERMAGRRVADQAEVLTYHYGTALTLARTAKSFGALTEAELAERTSRFLVLAGDRAATLDIAKAHDHYQQALELVPPGDPERARMVVRAAEAAWQVGRFAEAEPLYEQAIGAFRVQNDVMSAGDAMARWAFVLWQQGHAERARQNLRAAVRLLERGSPGPELARAYAEMARILALSGEAAASLEWVDKAIALTGRLDAGSIRQRALQFRGIARFDLGDLGGVEDLREAVRLGQQLGLGRETALAYHNYGFHLFSLEGPAAALPSFRSALALSEQRGITETALIAQDAILSALTDLGDWHEAMDVAERLIAVYLASGAPSLASFAEERKAHILLCRGEVPEATRLMEKVLLHAGEMGDPQVLLNVLPTAARVEQARGDHDAAVRLVEELHQATRERPDAYRTEPLPTMVRVCVAAGRLSLIERLLDGIEACVPRHQHSLVTARAVFAEAREDFETASALYADAAERWAGHRVALEHGQALLGQGRCLTRLASPLGRGQLLEARTVFAGLEARPLLDETNDWLKQAITQSE